MQDERFTNLMKALGADLIRACRDLAPIVIALFLHQPYRNWSRSWPDRFWSLSG